MVQKYLLGLGVIIIVINAIIYNITDQISNAEYRIFSYDGIATKFVAKMDSINILRPLVRDGGMDVSSDISIFKQALNYYTLASDITSDNPPEYVKNLDFDTKEEKAVPLIYSFQRFDEVVTPYYPDTITKLNNKIFLEIQVKKKLNSIFNFLLFIQSILQVIGIGLALRITRLTSY